MSWAMAIGATVSGVGAIVKGRAAKTAEGKARALAEEAQADLDQQKDRFRNLDTSNPYLNMENTMEDLTVNTQASEFQRDQQMASQSNIMGQMRGAAGSSGIAALAQTLANQGSMDAQKSSANIAQQEQANEMAERGESARIQGLEREGELISRNAQKGKVSSLMGMAADDVSVQRSAEMAAQQQKQAAVQQGISSVAQVGVSGAAAYSQNGLGTNAAGDPRMGGGGGFDAQMFGAASNAISGGVGANLTPAQIASLTPEMRQQLGLN